MSNDRLIAEAKARIDLGLTGPEFYMFKPKILNQRGVAARLDYLRDWCKSELISGMKIHTTMLGNPEPMMIDGELTGYIPQWLQDRCKSYGLKIVGTDVRRGMYILEWLG